MPERPQAAKILVCVFMLWDPEETDKNLNLRRDLNAEAPRR
jgi:hypothetical protein